jgi:succinate dehydrogenase/fumarate reductase flavoprotein subunit
MRVLGLGSPDKVPPLTEKAAIELGGDILSEFFVFGVAASLIMFEYLRQSTNKTNKDNAMISKVDELEANYTQLVKTNEANEKRMDDMAKFVQEQKNKINELVDRLNKIDQFKTKKFSTQESQTTNVFKSFSK